MKTPVLLLAFNRVETAKRVFSAIRAAKPEVLYFAADGPRPEKPGEDEKCQQVRALLDCVDWDCEVNTLFREINLGCKYAVSSAIDWFFKNVEEGIVLEDDCFPSQSFFPFCAELLERYRDDPMVMQICGSNLCGEGVSGKGSYCFSRYGPVWGWASWRRAWNHYDVTLSSWPKIKEEQLFRKITVNAEEARIREKIYDDLYSGQLDTWDYQWGYAKMTNGGLSVIPSRNLISNIGFGLEATHTKAGLEDPFANMPGYELQFPLVHPEHVSRNFVADKNFVEKFMLRQPEKTGFAKKMARKIKGLFNE